MVDEITDNGQDIDAGGGEMSLEDSLSAAYDSATGPGQPRDESGRFARHDDEEGETTADEPGDLTEEVADEVQEGDADEPEQEVPAIDAPRSMNAQQQEAFRALPRDQQEFMATRMKEMEGFLTRKSQELSEQANAFAPIRDALSLSMQLAGEQDPLRFLQTVQQTLMGLATGSSSTLRGLAKQYNIDLDPYADHADESPEIAQMRSELAQIKLAQMQQMQRQQAAYQQQQQQESRTLESALDAFISAKDEAGNPAHPFLDDIPEQTLIHMVYAVKAEQPGLSPADTLKAAYDRAVWVTPDVRAKMQQAEQAKARQADAEKAKAAKAKARANVRTKGGEPQGGKPKSIEEAMAAAYDRMTG